MLSLILVSLKILLTYGSQHYKFDILENGYNTTYENCTEDNLGIISVHAYFNETDNTVNVTCVACVNTTRNTIGYYDTEDEGIMASELDGIGVYSDKVLEGNIQSDNYTFEDWERDNPHNGTHIVSYHMIISSSSSLTHNFTCTLISDNVYDGYVIPYNLLGSNPYITIL